MDGAVCTFGVFSQPVKIKQIVFLREKTGLPVVATLNDVERNIGHNDSGSSWHKKWIIGGTEKCNKNVVCPLLFRQYELEARVCKQEP